MKPYKIGELVSYNSIALITDYCIEWENEMALGLIVKCHKFIKDFNFGQDEFGNSIRYPKYVYTLLSYGHVVEVLDVDIINKV